MKTVFQINWDFSFPWLCWVWSVVKGSLQLPVSSWYTSMSCQQSWLLCPLPLSSPAETLGLETTQKIHREQKSGAAMAVSNRSINSSNRQVVKALWRPPPLRSHTPRAQTNWSLDGDYERWVALCFHHVSAFSRQTETIMELVWGLSTGAL